MSLCSPRVRTPGRELPVAHQSVPSPHSSSSMQPKRRATPPTVVSNAWVDQEWDLKAERLLFMNTRGPGCFDFKFYQEVWVGAEGVSCS